MTQGGLEAPARHHDVSAELSGAVLAAVARAPGGATSLKQIAARLGVRASTVSRVAAVLREREGLVDRAERQLQAVGRPTEPVRLGEGLSLVGLSISDRVDRATSDPGPGALVSRLTAVLTSLSGRRLCEPESVDLDFRQVNDNSGAELAEAVDQLVGKLARHANRRRLAGVGLALGGVIHDGTAVRSGNLAWHGPYSLRPALQKRFPDIDVEVTNDVNALAVNSFWRATNWAGADEHGTPPPDFVIVAVRTDGIGAAMYVNGELVEGHRGSAGEIGHTKVPDAAGMLCRCRRAVSDRYGCLEAFAAPARVIERLSLAGVKDLGDAASLTEDPAMQDYAHTVAAFEQAGRVLGQEVARAVTWLDPAVIIVRLPSEIYEASDGAGAAYRAALRDGMSQVYPEPPPNLLFESLDQADVVVAESAATVAFNSILERVRRGEERDWRTGA